MNSIILCEGKTDAILLGYYLMRVCGYAHIEEKINEKITVIMKQNN
jgi:hypothetical protein